MTIEEIKGKLNSAFGKYEFVADGHYYLCNGKRVGIGVTTFYGQFENEFDKETIAQRVADKTIRFQNDVLNNEFSSAEEISFACKQVKTIEEVLAEWDYKRDFSCDKGSTCHEFAQSLWSGEEWNLLPFDNSKEYSKAVNKIKGQAINFKNDYQDMLEHIKDEYIVGSEEYDIASAIDHLFYNKLTGGLVLVDYKTNTVLKGYNDDKKNDRYIKQMKIPLTDIKDQAIYHYHIQLSIYKYLIEKYTNLIVDEWFIVYMSENNDNYEIIETPYLKDEVEEILEMRKNMAKMILIMGEGGSGKTSSLRNLPPEEHFYIDCDKKGLNFKGWKEKYIEKKNYYKTDDTNTILSLWKKINDDKPEIKYITVDTINSIMIADEMLRRKDKGYDKWEDLAFSIQNLIMNAPNLRDDLTIIFIGHTQTDDDGFTKLLTNGKKLNKIGLEKYFNTVLLAKCVDGKYLLETRANNSTARTPFEAFDELEIDNDITKVIEVLKEY